MIKDTTIDTGSFRDPAGFVFQKNSIVYRQVNKVGQSDYDSLMSTGLYNRLVSESILIPHKEVQNTKKFVVDSNRYKIIQPEPVPFLTYPYEWSFSQLKDAALLTLKAQQIALEYGMILKDASAYNVQFIGKKPILIDTLSFKNYNEGEPWDGYKQFCEHFIGPLAMASYISPVILRSLRSHIDGIPLEIVCNSLPGKSRLNKGLLMHLFLHNSSQKKYSSAGGVAKDRRMSTFALKGLLASLEKTVNQLQLNTKDTEWGDYYSFTNYSDRAFKAKKKLVNEFLQSVKPKPKLAWDIGANNGEFSKLASELNIYTVASDIDPLAVEYNYQDQKEEDNNQLLLPMVQDLTNPSPSLGFAHTERKSLVERGPADIVMALALIHHLAIGNNLPLGKIAEFLSTICTNVIVEFVPKGDSKVDILLSSRKDIFPSYTEDNFEAEMDAFFKLNKKKRVPGTKRTLYLYQKGR